MEKIRIQNVKTGKIMEITKMAWDQLKRGGHSKNFDVVSNEKPKIKINVPELKPEKTSDSEKTSDPENKIEDQIKNENDGIPSFEIETPKSSRKSTK